MQTTMRDYLRSLGANTPRIRVLVGGLIAGLALALLTYLGNGRVFSAKTVVMLIPFILASATGVGKTATA